MIRITFAFLLNVAAFAHAADDPAFKYKLQHEADKIEATTKDGTTTFAVTCPTGIGNATIARTGEAWPKAVVLRLNLRALEGFNAAAGKLKMHAFVNTSSMKSVSYTKDGKAIEVYDAKHPLWTEIKIFDKDGKPTDATHLNKGGWFELHLPKDFFEGNPEAFTFNWIDYYRR